MFTEVLFNRRRVGWIHWLMVVAGHPGAEDISVEERILCNYKANAHTNIFYNMYFSYEKSSLVKDVPLAKKQLSIYIHILNLYPPSRRVDKTKRLHTYIHMHSLTSLSLSLLGRKV